MQYKNLLNQFFDTVIEPERDMPSLMLIPENLAALKLRMEVYQHGYKIRLAKAVVSDFPALQAYAGETEFRKWARAYTDSVRSTVYNLDKYTYAFPEFLAKYSDDQAAIELATLESSLNVVFMEAESLPLVLTKFAQVTPEQFADYCFLARPALRLFRFDYAVNDYLNRFRAAEAVNGIEHVAEYIAVCRTEFEVKRHCLDRNGFQVLKALCTGHSVGEAFDIALPLMQEPLPTAEVIQAWFQEWVGSGFFVT